MAALPPLEPLRALYGQYSADYAGEYIIQALTTWTAGDMAMAATRFEQARDSFDKNESPQEWDILDAWTNAAADLFMEQVEAQFQIAQQPPADPSQAPVPAFKAAAYDESKHSRDEGGKFTSGPDRNNGQQKPAVTPAQPQTAAPTKPQPPAKPTQTAVDRKLPESVQALVGKYYAGSDAKRMGWSAEEFGQIVTGIEKTLLATGKACVPCTLADAQRWAEGGKIKGGKLRFGLNTDAPVSLVVDNKALANSTFEVDGEEVPGHLAGHVLAAKFAGTMSHLYAPVFTDTFKNGYLPFWAAKNLAVVMGDRVKGIELKSKADLPLDDVRGVLVLGKLGTQAKELQAMYNVGVIQGDSSDDLMGADLEAAKPKPKEGLAAKVKKAVTLATYPTLAAERVRRAWVTRHARYGYRNAQSRQQAAQRAAGGIPSRYTAGRFAQLANQVRASAQAYRAAARQQRVAEHNAQMSGGRFVKGVSAQTLDFAEKHMGPGPHPDGTPQSVHSGNWKTDGSAVLRQKIAERIEQVKLKSGETKAKTVVDFKWTYADTGQEVTPTDLDYLKKLGIGPAYTNVRVNPDFMTDGLVAEYDDVKGRSVRLYSKAHSQQAAQEKFERLKAFDAAMPRMLDQMQKDIDSPDPKTKAAARVLMLVAKTAFRIGSDRDTGADKQAYGASTLQVRHAKVNGNKVTFKFVGKKGVDIKQEYDDPELARLVTEQQKGKKAADKLWEADDSAVREYLDTLPGAQDFLVKDFRTWNATRWALEELAGKPKFDDEKAFAKFQKEVATKVAARLGNTPVMALGSYISYQVWDAVRQPQWGAWVPPKLK